jgi:hypothetical protein
MPHTITVQAAFPAEILYKQVFSRTLLLQTYDLGEISLPKTYFVKCASLQELERNRRRTLQSSTRFRIGAVFKDDAI